MATLAEIRAQHPEYSDLTDQQLADGIYKKFYADMPRDQFDARLGLKVPALGAGGKSDMLPMAPGVKAPPDMDKQAALEAANSMLRGMPFQNLPLGIGPTATVSKMNPRSAAIGAGDMASFGTADEIAAWLKSQFGADYGTALTDARQRMGEAQKADPLAYGVGQFAGGAPAAVLSGGTGPLGLAATGFGLGAAYGFGSGEGGPENRLVNAAINGGVGAVTGLAVPAVGKAIGRVFGGRAPRGMATADIKAASEALYTQAKNSGLAVAPKSMQPAFAKIRSELYLRGLDPDLHPDASAALKRLMALSDKPATIQELDIARQVIGEAAGAAKAKDRAMAVRIKELFDDYLDNLKPGDVLGGDPRVTVPLIKEARSLWAKKSKLELLESIAERAKDKVGANYSQANLQTALRQEFKSIKRNRSLFRQFSADEQDAITRIVRGGAAENFLRGVGKMAPHGPISGGFNVGVGALVGSHFGPEAGALAGATTAAVGEGARRLSTAASRRSVQALDDLVRTGSIRGLSPRALSISRTINPLLTVPAKVLPPILLNSPSRPALAR